MVYYYEMSTKTRDKVVSVLWTCLNWSVDLVLTGRSESDNHYSEFKSITQPEIGGPDVK